MADFNYITASGVIAPDTGAVKAEVEAEWRQIFGDDFVTDPSTPQGALIAAEVAARQSVVRNNATLANQINPNYAGGVFLDAIFALMGGQRTPAIPTTVTATLSGVAGTLVPAGSQARTAAGDLFELTTSVTIGAGGSVSGTFQSVTLGPIPCGAGALSEVVSAVLGWETVTNATAGTLGRATESDAAARLRRRRLLGANSRSTAQAIMAKVLAVPGVSSMTFLENVAATTQTINTISMSAHSVWACVQGGVDGEIAAAILQSKAAGTATNGAVLVSVTDPASGQAYSVRFDRPTAVPMLARVTVRANSSIANPESAIRDAIMVYVNGQQEGEPGFTVGEDVSPFELASAVGRALPALYVSAVEVATVATPTYQTTTYAIGINQIATLTANNISVLVT